MTIDHLREDVIAVLRSEFATTCAYQLTKNQVRVTMTFEEYVGLWSPARLRTIARKLDEGQGSISRYLGDRFFRPVCSWRTRECLIYGGEMNTSNARIVSAEESRRLFQFKAGDRHSPVSKERIGRSKRGVAQTAKHVRRRTAGQVGIKRGPMSEDAKAKMRATKAARKAGVA